MINLIQKELGVVKIYNVFFYLIFVFLFCYCKHTDIVNKNDGYLIVDIFPSRNINSFSVFIDFTSKNIIVKNRSIKSDNLLTVEDNILTFNNQDQITELYELFNTNDFCSEPENFTEIIDGVLTVITLYDSNKVMSCEKINYSEIDVKIIKIIMEHLIKNDKKNSINFSKFYNLLH